MTNRNKNGSRIESPGQAEIAEQVVHSVQELGIEMGCLVGRQLFDARSTQEKSDEILPRQFD